MANKKTEGTVQMVVTDAAGVTKVVETELNPKFFAESVKEGPFVQPEFTKESILKHERYKNRVDLLQALLEDNARYTHKEVDLLIKEFLERKVK